MEICVLHTGWKSEEEKDFQCGYALLEQSCQRKREYAIRCFIEGARDESALCWVHPRLANTFEKAYALLYDLAAKHVFPIHLEDVLSDMEW